MAAVTPLREGILATDGAEIANFQTGEYIGAAFIDPTIKTQTDVVTFNVQTANYTVANTDLNIVANGNKMVVINVASANTLTIPPDSTLTSAVNGHSILVCQEGAGQTTITAGSGVTLQSANGFKLRAQYAFATLYKRSANTWYVAGDVTT